jgi:hypothetical protein
MNKTTTEQLTDTIAYIHNEDWNCETDKRIKLGLIAEAIDQTEISEDFDKDAYSVINEVQIVVDNASLSEDYLKQAMNEYKQFKNNGSVRQLESYVYSGGVPVNMEGISGAVKCDVDNETRTYKNAYGERKTRVFRTIEDAIEYAKTVYAHNAIALFGLVGFWLDKTVNLVGTTGWDIVELQALNKDYL